MRIDGFSVRGSGGVEPSDSSRRQTASPAAKAGERHDASDISALAGILSPESGRGVRIEELRAAVAGNSYSVPGALISRKIVDYYLGA